MILSHVHITNYKQYGGSHDIEIPQVGTIGVIGANGVGKTTLFEAIEWALYSPSTIRAAEVKPRVWRGKTEVRVTIDDVAAGIQYTVERELGTGSAKARIYRIDASGIEEKIVDGASQVTNYVINHLIGLDHTAFVATFFTRQKELGFFNGSPTTRRRDVGKLLGLETIRDAQQIIADDRKRTLADARSYRVLSEESLKDRDFPAEIAAAEQSIATHKHVVASATSSSSIASTAAAAASTALKGIESLRDQDVAFAQQIAHRQREHDLAMQQSANAARELERLALAEAERDRVAPLATSLPTLQADEAAHATIRQLALRKREIEQSLAALARRDGDAAASTAAAISAAPAPDGSPHWHVNTPDDAIKWAGTIEIKELEHRAADLGAAVDSAAQLQAESQRLTQYHQRVNELLATRQSLIQDGDPAERLHKLDETIAQLNASTAAAESTGKRLLTDLHRSERVIANLQAQHEGELCPTCQRPFTAEDTAEVLHVFQRQVETYKQQVQAVEQHIAANAATIRTHQGERQPLADAVKQLTETNASIESGKKYVEEQQAKVDDLSRSLDALLSRLHLTTPPTVHDRDAAQREVIAWRKVIDAAAIIARMQHARTQIAAEHEPQATELLNLRDIAYDEAEHKRVTEQLQQARQAQATIDRITTELAQREGIVQHRAAADSTATTAAADLADLHRQRHDLGFDVTAFQGAQSDLQAAQQREREAVEQRHRAEVALRDADHALKTITAEQERIGRLVLEAEAKQREADDLDLMYKEFTEFERYAAAWYAPRLSEFTSDLVSQVTDGKYDRVEFDNNFSIQVFDGTDEKFPYETFSGGERDAIALCARIALSRVIGGASSTPPGFLVLDEVFGSLDLARRQRLLEMLGAITGADDHFSQVFLISHVDDVRTSPVLDDIWQVVQTEAGTSELHMLGVGVDIGEI